MAQNRKPRPRALGAIAAALVPMLGCGGAAQVPPETGGPEPGAVGRTVRAGTESAGDDLRAPNPDAPPRRPLLACRAAVRPLPPPTDARQEQVEDLVERCQAIILDGNSSCKAVSNCRSTIGKLRSVACIYAEREEAGWSTLCDAVRAREVALSPCTRVCGGD